MLDFFTLDSIFFLPKLFETFNYLQDEYFFIINTVLAICLTAIRAQVDKL